MPAGDIAVLGVPAAHSIALAHRAEPEAMVVFLEGGRRIGADGDAGAQPWRRDLFGSRDHIQRAIGRRPIESGKKLVLPTALSRVDSRLHFRQ